MASSQRTLVLTGSRAGTTCVLGKHRFKDGKTVISGDESSIIGETLYMGRVYKAFPEGSPELRFWQEVDSGQREYPSGARRGSPESFRSDLRSPGDQAATLSADHSDGADNSTRGQSGSIPVRDGQQDSGNDGQASDEDRIRQALKSLDPANDEHWTVNGRPRMDAVEAAYGSSGISRGDIERVAPGFSRPSL